MDDKLLKAVQEAAALAYPMEDIIRQQGLDPDEAAELYEEGTALNKAYWAGFYPADIRWRKSVFDLAAKGSSPAQTMVKRMMEELEMRRFYEQ